MSDKGVALNIPDFDFQRSISQEVNKYLDGTSHKGALLTVATTEGVNVIAVTRIKEKFEVSAWIGKKWGAPLDGGVRGIVYF